jgi:hypothetical protein
MLCDKHGDFSDNFRQTRIAQPRFGICPVVLLTADPARGMKTRNSEPDG